MKRKKYHSDFIVAYLQNKLDQSEIDTIPKSTRYNWRKNKEKYLVLVSPKYNIDNTLKCLVLILLFIKIYLHKDVCKKLMIENKDQFIGLIHRCQRFSNNDLIWRFIGISSHFYYYHAQNLKCSKSLIHICFRKRNNQLSFSEIENIKKYFYKNIYWPLSSTYLELKRDYLASYSISTFYKYTKLLELKYTSKLYCKHYPKGIRATKPGEIIHADITEFKLDHKLKFYVFLVIDNFSKKILSYAVMQNKDAKVCAAKIREAFELCDKNAVLITDDGNEFSSFEGPPIHLIAQKDIRFSNSMIEAFNKILKHFYLFRKNISSFSGFIEFIEYAVNDYNNRPHQGLKGSSPNEIFNNTPFVFDELKIKLLREQRMLENKSKCCLVG